MIKIEQSDYDTPAMTSKMFGNICRFCLSEFPDSDMMWMQWQDWNHSLLSSMYERITQSKLPISQLISELCCSKCSDLISESNTTLDLIEKANQFWSNHIKNAGSDSVICEDDYDVDIKEEVHQEVDPLSKYECVSLMISPATMEDVMMSDSKEKISYPDNENCADSSVMILQIQKQPSIQYSCKYCGISFKNIIKYQEHESGHTNTPYICVFCGQEIKPSGLLHRHLRNTHQTHSAQCNVCGKTFSDKSRLTTHIKRHDKEKYECDICHRKFSMRNYIVTHMETHCKDLQYSCDKCDRRFRTMNSFYAHKKSKCSNTDSNTTSRRRRHNTAIEKDYLSCHICKQPYLAVLNLQRHYHKRHAGAFDTICLDCNQKFSNIEENISHKETAHPNLQCSVCKQKMLSQESLKSHISNHSKQDRPFKCEICGAAFTRAAHLKSHHRRVHTTERPFKCKTCGYGFAENFSLTEHIKLKHSTDELKPFPCQDCGKRFLVKSALKEHMFVHTGIGRFKCDKCPMILRKAANLQQHHAIYHPVL